MPRLPFVAFDARIPVRAAVDIGRRNDAEFVLLENGPDLFAFKPDELALVEDIELPALDALALQPWMRSCTVTLPLRQPVRLLSDPTKPSTLRCVVLGGDGKPLRVEEPSGNLENLGGYHQPHDVPLAPEGVSIVRYPSIDVTGTAKAGETIVLHIDLARERDEQTAADPIAFDDLPAEWREIPVNVAVVSPQLEFVAGIHEGTVRVRRDLASVPCILAATVKPDVDRVDVTVAFSRNDRWIGTARRTFGTNASATVGSVSFVDAAVAPDLTIHIHRDSVDKTRLHWLLAPAVQHRELVRGNLWSESRLGAEPEAFVRGLFKAAASAARGKHVRVLHGIGQALWSRVPREVQETYWIMRSAKGDEFSIQFLTDDPWIPWELMRPVREGADTRLLAETHPVARGLLEYPDRLRPKLPARGERVTVAPDYQRRNPPLPALAQALEESSILHDEFAATALAPPTARKVLDVLEDRLGMPIQILHFAGHGSSSEDDALFSTIAFEDTDLQVAEVRREEVVLGKKHKTFVILNACEAGGTGDVLGQVGGWAEAFAYREFSGFLAPLWAVFDGHAKVAMHAFLQAVLKDNKPVGVALRDVRREYGADSATFLSYVYYGDVNARFG